MSPPLISRADTRKLPSAVGQSLWLLLPLVYQQLRELAASRMLGERVDRTLQGTALVHEAYLRLFGS
ncbi:MAG: ECF-type sigma factor, partial [Pirellulaceae bacterium]